MTQTRLNVSSLWFLYFRQERRIDCYAEKIPQQFEHFILANSLLIGNNEKSNENMGKNKDGNYEEHNSNNVFPDYETCDEMPKYEDWF